MRRSDTIESLSEAMTAFQKSTPKIDKTKTGKIKGEGKAGSYEYDYKYADLASIWDKVRGNLADNDLAVFQSPTTSQAQPALTTLISHKSGQWVEDTMLLSIVKDTPQGQGSAITYARRYMFCAMLGIVAETDTDAKDHQTINPIQKKQLRDKAVLILPELANDESGLSVVRFLTEVLGKHPSRVLETEFDDAIASVESYTKNVLEDEDDDKQSS